MRQACVIFIALGFAASGLAAQSSASTPLEIGRSIRIESRILGETRVIDVSLPRNYATTTARYPVLYVLDGEFEHEIAAAIARFYATMSQAPPMIVVGIRNTDRARDMTTAPVPTFMVPPEVEGARGGADKFLDCIAHEIIPYVERAYRTEPLRVLVGHSLGGLLAVYALASRPTLFTGYIIMEPATWWNDRLELRNARHMLTLPSARHARVVMVNGEPLGVDTTRWGGEQPMVRELTVSGETHQSMAAEGLLQGLRTMFADFTPSVWRPGTQPIAMLERYDSLAARVGYTVPIPASAFSTVVRMSLDSRHFDDAERALARMESAIGVSDETREFRQRLARERAQPAPANWIPLEIPARRPTPRDASRFLGTWVMVDDSAAHRVEIRASDDTIVLRDHVRFPNGTRYEGDDPVVQVTPDGVLEWGLPWFRGLAALMVLRGRILDDGTMSVSREPRGWIPRGPAPEFNRVDRFRRLP